jgi:30S ribosomal protein S31
MGKGDKKSRKGKIANNSFGARRPRKIKHRPSVEEKINIKKKK